MKTITSEEAVVEFLQSHSAFLERPHHRSGKISMTFIIL